MNKCNQCSKEISIGRKFCSKSCSTRFNNLKRVKEGTLNLLKKNGGSELASKSCSTRFNNLKRVKEGTLNLLKKNGGSELASKSNIKRVEDGTHSFLKSNFKEESKYKASIGIKNARLRESLEGNHPWQTFKSRINNELSRSLTVIKRDSIKELTLYISDLEDEKLKDYVKIGWTRSIEYRECDNRTYSLRNVRPIVTLDSESIVKLEHSIKLRLMTKDIYDFTGSCEIFPRHLIDQIIELSKSN